jgi:hypothetical protein
VGVVVCEVPTVVVLVVVELPLVPAVVVVDFVGFFLAGVVLGGGE